jgi:hypothetical protein
MIGMFNPPLRGVAVMRVVQAVSFLKIGLALAPGPDPESASSFLRGASSWQTGHPVCGPWRSVSGSRRWPRTPRQSTGSSNACLVRPFRSFVTQHISYHLAPRFLGRAERGSGTRLRNYPRTRLMYMWAIILRYPERCDAVVDTSRERKPVGSGRGS